MNRITGTGLFRALALGAVAAAFTGLADPAAAEMKRVAIANFGPHPTLDQSIEGLKLALTERGYVEGETVTYEYSHGNFDPSLVAQILRGLEATNPDVLVTITTPITQASVDLIQNKALPIVCSVVVNPVKAGVVPDWEHGSDRYVCSSNLQSMEVVLDFATKLLGEIKTVGMLYNPGDVADTTQLADVKAAVEKAGLALKAEGVESVNDIQNRTMALRGVDFIYVPSSSLLQPALPAAAAAADRMGVPIINASHPPVRDGVVLASMSISWDRVGYNAGVRVAAILDGAKPSELSNHKPGVEDHSGLISGKRLAQMGKTLPAALADCNCVVD
jgi:putative ABC transport system substrate-binding protein